MCVHMVCVYMHACSLSLSLTHTHTERERKRERERERMREIRGLPQRVSSFLLWSLEIKHRSLGKFFYAFLLAESSHWPYVFFNF